MRGIISGDEQILKFLEYASYFYQKRSDQFQQFQLTLSRGLCSFLVLFVLYIFQWKGQLRLSADIKNVLKSVSKVRTMTEAFRINDVDRGTIKMTAAIAELNIVDPVTFNTLKYDPATETLQSFAKRCAMHITP